MLISLVSRLMVVVGALTIFNSSLGYPISYGRLYNPLTGVCVDVIGDLHLPQGNDAEAAVNIFLEALKQLEVNTKTPINLLWEGGEENLHLADTAAEKLHLEHQNSLFMANGLRRLKDLALHNTTIKDIDDRPREMILALWLTVAAKSMTSEKYGFDSYGRTSLSEQILAFEKSLAAGVPALTIKHLIHAYEATERTILNNVEKLDEQSKKALSTCIQSAHDEWQALYTTYFKDHEDKTFALRIQELALHNKLEQDFFGAMGAAFINQLGDAMFSQKTCQSIAERTHTIVVTGALHTERIITALTTKDLGFFVCHNIFPLRGDVSPIIPNEWILSLFLPRIHDTDIPALDKDTWKHLPEDPTQSYENSTDYLCVYSCYVRSLANHVKALEACEANNKKFDDLLKYTDELLITWQERDAHNREQDAHNAEVLRIWKEQDARKNSRG